MKVAFCLIFTLTLLFLYSDAAIEEEPVPIDCSGFPRLACTKEFEPHCASNGKTYANRCHFCNAHVRSRGVIRFSYYGKCKK